MPNGFGRAPAPAGVGPASHAVVGTRRPGRPVGTTPRTRRPTVAGRCRIALGTVGVACAILWTGACHRAVAPLVEPGRAAVALTAGPNTSMIYVARTDAGVLVIDLGWWGAQDALRAALRRIDAAPNDVIAVALTHSHRDHVGAWPLVRHRPVYLAAAEVPALFGRGRYRASVPRLAERIAPRRTPTPADVVVRPFTTDTMWVFGRDTLRAYLVPGHTSGSAVYLFRGTLFLGDAVTYQHKSGFAPARAMYSEDPEAAARNLHTLWPRLPIAAVRYVCTAHARCTAFTPAFLRDVER